MKIDCCIIHSRLWVIHWVCGSLSKQCIPGLVWANGFSQVDGVFAPAANQVIARETFVSLRQKTTRLFLYFCHQTSGWNKLKTVELFQGTLNWQHMSDSSGRPIITPPSKANRHPLTAPWASVSEQTASAYWRERQSAPKKRKGRQNELWLQQRKGSENAYILVSIIWSMDSMIRGDRSRHGWQRRWKYLLLKFWAALKIITTLTLPTLTRCLGTQLSIKNQSALNNTTHRSSYFFPKAIYSSIDLVI